VKEHEAQEAVIAGGASKVGKQEDLGMALYAGHEKKRGKGDSKYDWGNTKAVEDACHRCGRTGHQAAHCFADMPKDVKDQYLAANMASTVILRNNGNDREETYTF
jgi:hypothetical protein